MPLFPSRHDSIAGSVVRSSRMCDGSPQADAARRARTPAIENPFASFYKSRRKLSIEDGSDETPDPSSSITRAYIVPEALLALARQDHAAAPPRPLDATSSRSPHGDAGSPSGGFTLDWRSMQLVALSMVGWLRRAWRRSIPD